MRHEVSSVLALALLLGLPAASSAGPIVQDFSNEARNIFPLVGQSFTAEDPFIDTVGAYVVDFTFGSVATDTTIDYQLYAGFGNGGALLGTRAFSGLVDGFGGYADVSFAGIPLVVGSTYTLFLTNDTNSVGRRIRVQRERRALPEWCGAAATQLRSRRAAAGSPVPRPAPDGPGTDNGRVARAGRGHGAGAPWLAASCAAKLRLSVLLPKRDSLRQRQRIRPVDRVRLPAHVGLPRVRSRLAAAAGFLLAAERAADFRARRADVDVGDAAVRSACGEELFGRAACSR